MSVSRIYYYNSKIGFPCGLVGKKLYINDKANECVSAVKVISIMVKLNPSSSGNIHGAFSALNVRVCYKKATKNGVVGESINYNQLKLYANPTDAANGVNEVYPIKAEKKACADDKMYSTIGGAILDAFDNSILQDVWVTQQSTSATHTVTFGSYVWDGLKPVFKPFDISEHLHLIYTEEDGWGFDNNDFTDLDLDEMFLTEEECREAHSVKIYEFAEDF
jgi:hypothetical protein